MERRFGVRARTDFGVLARAGWTRLSCRGIEVSRSGIVLDRGRIDGERELGAWVELELDLPERCRKLRVLARPIWRDGTLQAFKFVRISDVDRLTLAEHLDLLKLRGVTLC